MNDDTKYDHTRRRVAGVVISRVLKRYGIGAKLAGAGAVVAVAAVVAGAYYGIDIDLGDDTVPLPPIVEPVNETIDTPALIEGPEDSNKITIGQSPPPAPSSNTEETEWSPTPSTEGEYVAALTERERDIYSRGYNTGILARGRINFGTVNHPPRCPQNLSRRRNDHRPHYRHQQRLQLWNHRQRRRPPRSLSLRSQRLSRRPRLYRQRRNRRLSSDLKSRGLCGSLGVCPTTRLSGRGTP